MRVIQVPAHVLTTKAETIVKFDNKLLKLVEEMIDTLEKTKDPEGVGLAAVQVGIAKRIFVMNTRPESTRGGKYESFINPKIIEKEKDKADKVLEGCLSIENIWGYPERASGVKLVYQDLKGKKHTKKFIGFGAVIVQHEVDHLQGRLFTHRVIEEGKDLYRIDKDEHGESELVPLEL